MKRLLAEGMLPTFSPNGTVEIAVKAAILHLDLKLMRMKVLFSLF